MPSKPQYKPNKISNDYQVRWVDPQLSEQEKRELKEKPFDLSAYEDCLLALTEQDYSIKLQFDVYSRCFVCHVVPKGEKHINKGMILSGRGSTALKALKQAYFKHHRFFDGGSWGDGGQMTGESIDD